MGLALFKERRMNQRKRLTGLLPGRLIYIHSGRDLAVKPVDISSHGIGIVVSEELELGSQLRLQMKDRSISFRVAWGQPDFSKSDRFRYGLIAVDAEIDVELVFTEAGCLV